MVDRKILDERGIFTCDMQDLQERLNEAHCTLLLIVEAVNEHTPEAATAIEGVGRMICDISMDLNDVEEVLRERGGVVTPEQARQRAASMAVAQ